MMVESASELVRRFIGAWSLVSWTATARDGGIRHPYGEQPIGQIIYDSGGRMAACLMRRERTPFASENRHAATSEERDAAYREFVAYFGTFDVDEERGVVRHHVAGSTFSNWIGTDLVRSYHFEGDRLTLSLVGPDGAVHELLWRR